MPEEILSISQTADYLQVCDKTVRNLIKSNKLTAYKIGKRSWRIKRSDIDTYLYQHTNKNEGGTYNE